MGQRRVMAWVGVLVAAMALPASHASAATVTVTGLVTDRATKQLLGGAEVTVRLRANASGQRTVLTTPAGAYTASLDVGQPDLLLCAVTAPGYQAMTVWRPITTATESMRIDLAVTRYPLISPSPSPSPNPEATALQVLINRDAPTTNSREVTVTLLATPLPARMAFSNDGRQWSPPEAYQATTAWQLSGDDGLKTVYASVFGRAKTWSAPASDTIRLDTTPPLISALQVADITPTSATIRWRTNEPATSGVAYGALNRSGSGILTPINPKLVILHAVTLTQLSPKTEYQARAVAADAGGAMSVSDPATFTTAAADPLPPTVSLTSPAPSAAFRAPATIELAATASDADGTITTVAFFQGATKLGETAAPPYRFSWPNVAAGTYTLTATAIDHQGLTATSSPVTITVTPADKPSEPPPTGTIVINGGDEYTNSPVARLALALTAPASADAARVQMAVANTNSPVRADWWESPFSGSKDWRLSDGAGKKTVWVRWCATSCEEWGQWSEPVSDTIGLDTTPPSAPSFTSAQVSSLTTVSAEWSTGFDPESGVTEYQYRLTLDSAAGPELIGWTSTGTRTSLLRTDRNFTVGVTYVLSVKAKNGAGAWSEPVSSAPLTLPQGLRPPGGTILLNHGTPLTNARGVTVTVLPAPDAGAIEAVWCSNEDAGHWAVPTKLANNEWAWELSEGDAVKTVYAKFGNASGQSVSPPATIRLDTARPVISDVQVADVTRTTAVVTWTTSEPATSRVAYGPPNTSSTLTPLDARHVTAHAVTLTGLQSKTAYQVRAVSVDEAANETVSEPPVPFTTPADTPPDPVDTVPPRIQTVLPPPGPALYAGGPLTVSATVLDTDPSPLEYQFSTDGAVRQAWSGASSYAWPSTATTPGRHTMTVEVRDAGGADAKTVTVYLYRKPPELP